MNCCFKWNSAHQQIPFVCFYWHRQFDIFDETSLITLNASAKVFFMKCHINTWVAASTFGQYGVQLDWSHRETIWRQVMVIDFNLNGNFEWNWRICCFFFLPTAEELVVIAGRYESIPPLPHHFDSLSNFSCGIANNPWSVTITNRSYRKFLL